MVSVPYRGDQTEVDHLCCMGFWSCKDMRRIQFSRRLASRALFGVGP